MPTDKFGNYHFNRQRADAAGGMDKPKEKPPMAPDKSGKDEPEGDGSAHTTLHDHGDGTFHTESHDGEKTEHPHIGHALMHMAGKHSVGRHFHAHHDGGGITTHHHTEEGGTEGPHEHGSTEEAMDHMGSVMNGDEPNSEDGEAPENATDEGDLTGF